MKKIFFVLACITLLASCEKNESSDLLVYGTWVLDNRITYGPEVSIKFNSDRTYVVSQFIGLNIAGTISGDWLRLNNDIMFTNSKVNLINNRTVNDSLRTSLPLASFFGYSYLGVYQSDSSDNHFGTISNNSVNYDIFQEEDPNQRKWTILKLTDDSLIVKSARQILKYHKAKMSVATVNRWRKA